MRKQERIAELLELMKVPEVAKVIFLTIDEVKGKLKDEIDQWRRSELLLKKLKEAVHKDSYRFELKKTDDEWHVISISPEPIGEIDFKSMIMTDVLPHFQLNIASPKSCEILNEFISKENHDYNIQFIKFADNHVFGIILEIVNSLDSDPVKEIEIENIEYGYETKSNEEKYREMFYYMEKDPYIREFLLDLFFILLKPDSDKELSSII